jgi:putative transposase
VLVCFGGALPAWSISPAPDEELSDSMLEEACAGLAPDEHPVIHSDRGCHYGWPGWIAICERSCLIRSMSAKGCSPDNSAMEGFFGRLKNEFFYGREWSGVGLSEFMELLDACLRYHNKTRPKERLGWTSPMQYRRSLGLAA